MNKMESGKLIALCVSAIPSLQNKDLKNTVLAWSLIMPDISYEEGKVAIVKLLRERKYATLPQPGEIISTVKQIVAHYSKEELPPPDYLAWEEAIHKLSPTTPVTNWSHPLIGQTVRHIGSWKILHAEYDISTQFMRVYNCLVKRYEDEKEYQAVAGVLDIVNNAANTCKLPTIEETNLIE